MEVVSIIYNGTGQSYQNYKEIDENFERIENVPMRGFRWSDQNI